MIIVILFQKLPQKQWNDPTKQSHPWTPPTPPAVSLYTERWSRCTQLLLPTKWASWRRIGTDSNLLDGKACWMGFSRTLPHCASSTDSRASTIGVMCREASLFEFKHGRIKYYININYLSFKGDNSPCFFFAFLQNVYIFFNFFCTTRFMTIHTTHKHIQNRGLVSLKKYIHKNSIYSEALQNSVQVTQLKAQWLLFFLT